MPNGCSAARGNFSTSQRFEIGPTVGARLPLGFSVEGDALYKRESFNFGQFGGFTAVSSHSDSWEFPVMLKFAAGHGVIAPVVGAGVTVRRLNNFGGVPSFLFHGASTNSNTVGLVAGAGVRFRLGVIDVTPELRYMRWTGDSLSQTLGNFLPLNRNEGSVLVGFTF